MNKKKKTQDELLSCNILNSIKSGGNVEIKVYNNNKLIQTIKDHNTGTIELCKYVRDVMIGLGTSINQPTVIKPCSKSGNILTPISNQGVPFTTRWRGDDSSTDSIAVIKFIIPWTQLAVGRKIGGFRLYSKNTDNDYYAEIILNDEIEVWSHTNIEVTWSLKITYAVNI